MGGANGVKRDTGKGVGIWLGLQDLSGALSRLSDGTEGPEMHDVGTWEVRLQCATKAARDGETGSWPPSWASLVYSQPTLPEYLGQEVNFLVSCLC